MSQSSLITVILRKALEVHVVIIRITVSATHAFIDSASPCRELGKSATFSVMSLAWPPTGR